MKRARDVLTARELREWFSCDFTTGVVTWRRSPHPRVSVGARVGSMNSRGYCRTKLRKHHIFVHHIVWVLFHGRWPDETVDHINRIKSDNRIENLRDASSSLQQRNRRLPNRHGLRGVKLGPYVSIKPAFTWVESTSIWEPSTINVMPEMRSK